MQQPDAVVPVLQVRNLDFSYGKVQVLFDIDFDVHEGETLALLGTNGAGKSTLLRVISGLGVAERGVVRFHGRTSPTPIPSCGSTSASCSSSAARRAFGAAHRDARTCAWPAFLYDRGADLRRRIDKVAGAVPRARERRTDTPAADLSGGQQQMLALAMTLVHEPEVLIIDELSLGLAPVVVQQVLEVVQRCKDAGITMIIVEQSLNVALAIADRAVFMEKGQIRFEGSTARAGRARRPRPGRVPRDADMLEPRSPFAFPDAGRLLRRVHRADLRRHGRRRHPHLPLDPGDQLRDRRDGRRSRAASCSPGWSSTGTCRSGWRSPRASSSARLVGARARAGRRAAAVRGAARHPARRDHRRRPGAAVLPSSSLPDLTTVQPLPDPRSPRPWDIGGVLVRGLAADGVLVVIPLLVIALALFLEPHQVRARDPGLGRQRRRRPAVGHQHQADVDDRLGDRRRAGHASARCSSRPSTAPRATTSARSARAAAPGARRRAHRRHGRRCRWRRRGWRRDRHRREPRHLQLSTNERGLLDLLLFVLVLVTLLIVGRRRTSCRGRQSAAGRSRPESARSPPCSQAKWWVRRLPTLGVGFRAARRADPAGGPQLTLRAVTVEPRAALRARRALAHRAHRLGRAALARPVRVRRRRRR